MKPADWIGNLVSIGLFVLLAVGSWMLSEFLQRSRMVEATIAASGPNAVIENARVVRSDKEGSARYVLDTRRIEHFDAKDIAVLERPKLVSVEAGKASTVISSQKATSSENQNRIDLTGDVVITRDAYANQPYLKVTTPKATVFVNEERAITDAPVFVQRGASTLQGIGMRLDQKTQKLEIVSESRMVVPKDSNRP